MRNKGGYSEAGRHSQMVGSQKDSPTTQTICPWEGGGGQGRGSTGSHAKLARVLAHSRGCCVSS